MNDVDCVACIWSDGCRSGDRQVGQGQVRHDTRPRLLPPPLQVCSLPNTLLESMLLHRAGVSA